MEQVVIVSAARTPMGAFLGNFKNLSAPKLCAQAINRCLKNYHINDRIDQVIMGCVLSAGIGQSPARQASIYAGLSETVPATNINKVCGSGMYAITAAKNAILAHDSDIVIAGGMESMSQAPYLLQKCRTGYRFGHDKLIDHMVVDGLENSFDGRLMGELAEKAAAEYNISRDEQDEYAKNSFEKAFSANESGLVNNEIAPIEVREKRQSILIEKDEPPFKVNLDKISTLRPAFMSNGTITAASSSSIADGAAALLMMSESKAVELNLNPIARIVATTCYAQSPELFATAPIGAIKQVLSKSGWSIGDVDLFEINEAFAVVAMSAMKELNINEEYVNIYGGACALGHPLGASGARIVVTLLNALKNSGKKKGLATLCVGGGEGTALTVEML